MSVHAWLTSLGALSLTQSAYLLPDRPAAVRAVHRLLARVRREAARGRLLHVTLDEADERETIDALCAERADEYTQIVGRTNDFLAEIELERSRGTVTYTELEESDADLARFQKWLAAVRKRDYFDADGREQAEAAVEACENALSDFEAEAFASELALRDEGKA